MKLLNPSFYDIFYFFSIYTKMSKTSSLKYYQENKERLKKKLMEDIKIILKKKKKKKQQYGCECYKNLSENEKKGLLSIEKIL